MLGDTAVEALVEHYRAQKHFGGEIRKAIRGEIDFAALLTEE